MENSDRSTRIDQAEITSSAPRGEAPRKKASKSSLRKPMFASALEKVREYNRQCRDDVESYKMRDGGVFYSSWAKGHEGRAEYDWRLEDYEHGGFRVVYTDKLYEARYLSMMEALSNFFATQSFKPSDGSRIVSVGSGPGAELIAAHDHFGNPRLKYLAVDAVEAWAGYVECLQDESFAFRKMDLKKTKRLFELLRRRKAEVVIFAHVLVDFGEPSIVNELFKRVENLKCIIVVDRYMPNLEPLSLELNKQSEIGGENYKYKGAVYMRKDEPDDLSAMMSGLSV
ncbi:hypothetical protein FI667_g3627, partial [Globisporangium splendens]